ncbi:histone H1-like [Carcharodon carcharias]|uniref:histone H1-like n=1 Tax=Carcharodon carcharias TaxID=13397 RepID=UPI001B7E446D|nr:histone H1-like [Carcharodon carcharias]
MAEGVVADQVDVPPPPPLMMMMTAATPPSVAAGSAYTLLAPSFPAPVDPASPAPPPLPTAAVAKKRNAYRPQKAATVGTVAEHILEALAATKQRQAPAALAARRKNVSAAAYDVEGAGVPPMYPTARAPTSKGPSTQGEGGPAPLQGGTAPEAGGELQKRPRSRKRSQRATSVARKPLKNSKGPKALKRSAAKPRKAAKRPATCRPVGRKRATGKRR